jgi:hypothetical protein
MIWGPRLRMKVIGLLGGHDLIIEGIIPEVEDIRVFVYQLGDLLLLEFDLFFQAVRGGVTLPVGSP